MAPIFWADKFRCAIFEPASGGGNPDDVNSAMNRPILNPIAFMSNVYFHSDLNYYGIAIKNLSRIISHAAVASRERTISPGVIYYGQTVTTTHNLVTHDLGYVPRFFCIYNGRLIPHGFPVQTVNNQTARFATAYATTTQIRLYEVGYSSASTLPSANIEYQIIVFRNPESDLLPESLEMAPGLANFGRGKFRANEPHLRVAGQGDVRWPIAKDRTAGISNGGLRTYIPNGGAINFMSYSGSLAPPSYIDAAAGV